MKKFVVLIVMAVLGIPLMLNAASSSEDQMMAQAKEAFAKKEYSVAAGKYIQAYNSYFAQKNYDEAARAIMRASNAYAKAKNYDEAMNLLNRVDKNFTEIERTTGKKLYNAHFLIERGRLNLYIIVRNDGGAKNSLVKLQSIPMQNTIMPTASRNRATYILRV